ncbi:nuclear transport factor 2 family protein [Streptosporangium sp. NBC_01495]|uniref:nuclear transport factor 2 family protein n=1 Tax=Streptosporangium sp. NBC_01495 TaxID=2903899 RepID=UPI002E37203C|nr:nuclear transport factor 2 family protein [Streptosporangium sp. NBC_01495]
MTDTTAAAVLRRGVDLLLAKDMRAYLALWHEDAVAEFPFAPPGAPRRLDGIAAITAYLIDYPDKLDIAEVTALTVHETVDPAVVIAEFTAVGKVVATGRPYEISYIAVVTVAHGRITHYRDYWNPMVVIEALGDDLLSDTATGATR